MFLDMLFKEDEEEEEENGETKENGEVKSNGIKEEDNNTEEKINTVADTIVDNSDKKEILEEMISK